MEHSFSVQEPFTPNNYADVIIRSVDNHDFHVVKVLLSMVSPFFSDMFTLPQPPSTSERKVAQGLPIVDVTESGPVADALLRIIYPVDAPKLSVELAFGVLIAADKYNVEHALQGAKSAIHELCSKEDGCVLRAFALSVTHNRKDEIRLAARESLRLPLPSVPSVHAMDSIPSSAVLALFRYHDQVGERIRKLFSSFPFPQEIGAAVLCAICSGRRYTNTAKWWQNLHGNLGDEKRTTLKGPLSEEIFSETTLIFPGCDGCKKCLWDFGIVKFVNIVRTEMEKEASKIEFQIN